jgi:UDP-N-acetylglucosamine 2-epimerase (non-hydrolysing)
MKLLHVVGTQPNFPKLAPMYREALTAGFSRVVVHAGQHYDESLSSSFFTGLGIPAPDINFEVGSLSDVAQTARIMERIEPVLVAERPD